MTVGVLVMAYGTPKDADDVAAYYTDIRRGNPPPPDLLHQLEDRYQAIGGTFPLRAITEQQCAALHRALDDEDPGRFRVALGQKHADPRIEAGVSALADTDPVVGLVLAPHHSALSVGEYARRAGPRVRTIDSWHLLPEYLDFEAAAVRAALADLPAGSEVVFTAHALPVHRLPAGDPYVEQLRATAAEVAARAGVDTWSVAWQSAGRTAEEWLGPDLLTVIRDRAGAGTPGLLACAAGFVADHLEVRYDLDIEARLLAADLGLPFARTRSVNADPDVMGGLARLVRTTAGD